MENIREFKSGDSVLDYCRECKGRMYKDEEDATICCHCVISMTSRRVNKYSSRKV